MITRLSLSRALIDIIIALAYLGIALELNGSGRISQVGIIGLLAVSLGFRRFIPILALGLAWFAAAFQMYYAHIGPVWPDLAILVVLYATAAYGDRTTRWFGFASAFVGAVLGAIYLMWGVGAPSIGISVNVHSIAEAAIILIKLGFNFGVLLLLLALPWTAGTLVRTRIVARESRRAQRNAELDAAAAEQDVIVEQERNRIARDMHDVVAHSLAVVIAQADGARYASVQNPAAADEALSTISTTAREALGDVRLLLGQLRHSQTEGPQPALEDLGRLLDQLRASALIIAFETEGTPLPMGTAQQLAVYRITQEALTNVLRHGDVEQEVIVHFTWTETDLEVTITSSTTTSPRTAELKVGHGLAGMRERAALVGGELTTTITETQFIVHGEIPASAAQVKA